MNDRKLFPDGKISIQDMIDLIPTVKAYDSEKTQEKYISNLKIVPWKRALSF